MKNLFKDIIESLKEMKKTNTQRLKVILLMSATISSLGLGGYGVFYTLNESGLTILLFLASCIGVWFGVGLLDMVRDMVKFNK